MDLGQLLPYLLSGSAAGAFLAALRWGRQDSRDAVEMSQSNSGVALTLRDQAMADNATTHEMLEAAKAEIARLRALLAAHGIDPSEAL